MFKFITIKTKNMDAVDTQTRYTKPIYNNGLETGLYSICTCKCVCVWGGGGGGGEGS